MSTTHGSSNLDKHQSGNPIVRKLLDRYFTTLQHLIDPLQPTSILDVGCGEGFTAQRLATDSIPYLGIDLNPDAVQFAAKANPGKTFHTGSVYELENKQADLVLCLEVLEHLDDPIRAIRSLKQAAIRHLIVSVPWEPWFRLGNLARGKYLSQFGNHPEHIQAFSPHSIHQLVQNEFGNAMITTSFPWVFVHAHLENT